MRLILQRVLSASVTVDSKTVSSVGPGVVALVGLHVDDCASDLRYCARKLVGSKLWPNDNSKPWRQSVRQMEFDVLLVSQFTLFGDVSNKKSVPDFKLSKKSEAAFAMYEEFKSIVAAEYGGDDANSKVHDGIFGANMQLALVNDGPVTLVVDSQSDQR